MDNQKKFDYYIKLIDKKLEFYINKTFVLHDEIYYSVMGGGKRIRPMLLLSLCENIFDDNNKLDIALSFACVIEFIHNYSLIHDDLPGMDNDDYRRNKLTCHKKFGEANAILTGDALLNLAFEIAINTCLENPDKKYLLLATKKIFDASGLNGMIKGQVLDINNQDNITDKELLEEMSLNKTAALIRASVETGVILDNNNNKLEFFSELANKIGLAFQIKDDIFDKDKEKNKQTYFNIYGEHEANRLYNDLSNKIYLDLEKLESNSYDFFKYLVKFIIERKN